MPSLRAGVATTILSGGGTLALLLPTTWTARAAGLGVVVVAAAAVGLFAARDPQDSDQAVGGRTERGSVAEESSGYDAARGIQRRRNLVICSVVAAFFAVMTLIGYGPWSH